LGLKINVAQPNVVLVILRFCLSLSVIKGYGAGVIVYDMILISNKIMVVISLDNI